MCGLCALVFAAVAAAAATAARRRPALLAVWLRPPQLGLCHAAVRRRLGRRLRPPPVLSLALTTLFLAIMRKRLVCALPPYVPLRSGLLVKHR